MLLELLRERIEEAEQPGRLIPRKDFADGDLKRARVHVSLLQPPSQEELRLPVGKAIRNLTAKKGGLIKKGPLSFFYSLTSTS